MASGCDNVEWGGTELTLEPPPSGTASAVEDTAAAVEPAEEEEKRLLPRGPVLFMGSRSGSDGSLVAVAEVAEDSLIPLPSETEAPGFTAAFVQSRLAVGTEFVLFAEGTRVGTLTTTGVGPDESFCGSPPSVSGVVELVPRAAGAERFLALRAPEGKERPFGEYRAPEHTYGQRVAGLAFARDLINQRGATWPESLLDARRDMQAFVMGDPPVEGIAATFLHSDLLAVSDAPDEAWAIFLMALSDGPGYDLAHAWYRPVDERGKGAPRFFQHFDWDGDGASEVLLEVLGEDRRWAAALARRDGQWRRIYQSPCGG